MEGAAAGLPRPAGALIVGDMDDRRRERLRPAPRAKLAVHAPNLEARDHGAGRTHHDALAETIEGVNMVT